MSVAKVAMSHGINDNIVHRWRQLARQQQTDQRGAITAQPRAVAPAQLVPLTLPAPEVRAVQPEVRLEIKRGAVTVGVAWPQNELGDLAAFVRELLK